jgi:16S rRNA (cytosine967-C5)-methyltransferase
MAAHKIFSARVRHALFVLNSYDGNIPFSQHLKDFYNKHKKFGSKDRKKVAELCFSRLRFGHAFGKPITEQQVALSYFALSNDKSDVENLILSGFLPENTTTLDWPDKLKLIASLELSFTIDNLFPNQDKLSKQLNSLAFIQNHLIRPLIWFRCKHAQLAKFKEILQHNAITFEVAEGCMFGFVSELNLAKLCNNNLGFYGEIQDLNSYRCVAHLQISPTAKVWDACAASGGKSLALVDKNPKLSLYVSDKRKSILENLFARFDSARLAKPKYALLDLTLPLENLTFYDKQVTEAVPLAYFDVILADVPCSGSGTWARNPEHLLFFDAETITQYAKTQLSIVKNLLPYLSANGKLLYVTCSAYETENELVIENILASNPQINLIQSSYLLGYENKADTLFYALLEKV